MLIVKVPLLNALGRTKGCEKAPALVINALKEIYTNEYGKEPQFKTEEIKVNNSNIKESIETIQMKASEIFEKNQPVIFIGGDHTITYPLMRAFSDYFKNKKTGIVIFDAHADCVNNTPEPTHEDWLRTLIEKGFNPNNVILIGARNIDKTELDFLMKNPINIFPMKELFDNIRRSCDLIMEATRKFDSVYISIDIDVIDPAFAPGTGYLESGGLTSREFIYLIQRLKRLNNLKAFDIIEINPDQDLNNQTVRLGAKILGELM
jgi:agmatinase